MNSEPLLEEVRRIIRDLEQARTEVSGDITRGLEIGQQLRDACREISNGSSDSWIGWHSRMYYGNFEQPPVHLSWDAEWGGLNGIPEGWRELTLREVQAEAERRARVSISEVSAVADRVRLACQPLREEVLAVISPVCDLGGLEKEAKLLEKIEEIDWITSPSNFIQALAPNQMWSRDTHAMSQGMQPPLHLNVEATIVSNTSTIARARDFLTDAVRLARQVKTKLEASGSTAQFVAGSQSDDAVLRRRLRRRSVALFGLLSVGVVLGLVWVLRQYDLGTVADAAIIVGGAIAVAALYGLLVDRSHALRALAAAGGAAGAIAAVDQLLAHL